MKKTTNAILVASLLLFIAVVGLKMNHLEGFKTLSMVSIFAFLLLFVLIIAQLGLKTFKKAN